MLVIFQGGMLSGPPGINLPSVLVIFQGGMLSGPPGMNLRGEWPSGF